MEQLNRYKKLNGKYKLDLQFMTKNDIIMFLQGYMGVYGCWCAPWSSKPVSMVKSCLGGFDSHIFPPKIKALRGYAALFLRK